MRTSCNGCRVLRKGCTEDCNIRPCIQWINSPESQANATLFLAKFYGRAGLMNLINAGPEHLRPAIFKSLLYEACGRIVDPINGSVGLLYSGNWPYCQAAVEAVLQGSPITQILHNPDAAASRIISPPRAAYDIRHASLDAQKVRTRTRSKRTRSKLDVAETSTGRDECRFSVETVEADWVCPPPVHPGWLQNIGNQIGDPEVGLELSLGLPYVFKAQGDGTINGSDDGDDMDWGS